MENTDITKTEVLVKVNKLKTEHEKIKKEIINLIDALNEKEKELDIVEKEYMKYVEKMI